MKYCPQCISKFDDQQGFCLDDGTALVTDPFFLTGQTLGGKFQIESLIDMGGMGAVYRARHRFLNLPLAFKIVRPDQASPFLIRLFEKEAQTAAPLRHPNIVEVSDAGRVTTTDSIGGQVEISYLAMEWLDGRTLDQELRQHRRLSFERTFELLQQICAALAFAHHPDRRTIHRDLKPSNIMLVKLPDGSERIKILDFGIGKVMSSVAGTIVTATGGTMYYRSPEQMIPGASIDQRADIYSLGVMLFEMVSGQLPRTFPVPPLRSALPDAPAALEDLLKRMTAQEPDERPRAVSDIPALFEQACRIAPPPPPAPPIRRPQPEADTPPTIPRPPKPAIVAPDGSPLTTFAFETVTVNDTGKIIERRKGQAQGFTEDLGNGVSLEMVAVPGGGFLIGSPPDEAQRSDDEGPQHQVTVPSFFMGRFQVTQAQWRTVAQLPKVKADLDPQPSHFKGNDLLPVEQVSWHDAQEFCARLSKKSGKQYRLPSEAEWEYACRAGTTTPFAFGETITPELVNYDGNYPFGKAAKGEYRSKTVPVGSLSVANAFGLYDLHGNVWEWCEDIWHDNYQGAPDDGSAWSNGGNQYSRVLRGGSWLNDDDFCRSADRFNLAPGDRGCNYGFRVVVSVRTQ